MNSKKVNKKSAYSEFCVVVSLLFLPRRRASLLLEKLKSFEFSVNINQWIFNLSSSIWQSGEYELNELSLSGLSNLFSDFSHEEDNKFLDKFIFFLSHSHLHTKFRRVLCLQEGLIWLIRHFEYLLASGAQKTPRGIEFINSVFDESLYFSCIIEFYREINSLCLQIREKVTQRGMSGRRLMERLIEQISRNLETKRFVLTGIEQFDSLIEGNFSSPRVLVVGSRPGEGKTSFLISSAAKQLKLGKKVLFLSFEMSKKLIGLRLLNSLAQRKISASFLRRIFSNIRQKKKFEIFLSRMPLENFFIVDSCFPSLDEISSLLTRLSSIWSFDTIFIDYLQLVSSKKSRDSRLSFHHDITEVMNQIAKFSKKFNVNFVIASQLSRSVEFRGGDPMLGDLKESGSIEQVADAVLFLKKKKLESSSPFSDYSSEILSENRMIVVEAILAKNRFGSLLKKTLSFDADICSFDDFVKSSGISFANTDQVEWFEKK